MNEVTVDVFNGVPNEGRIVAANRRRSAFFAFQDVDSRLEVCRSGREVFGRELDGRPVGLTVGVDGGDAVGVSRSEFEFSGRPGRRVGGERFFGRGDPNAVDERFDDVTGFVAAAVDPRQVDRQRFRVQNGRGQVDRGERGLLFERAEVDRSVEARIPGQVGRNRVGDVGVGALVNRLRTGGEGIIAVFRVRKERLRFVVDVLRRRVGRGVVPSGKARQRVVRVRDSGVDEIAARVVDEDRVVDIRPSASVNAGAAGFRRRDVSGNRGVVKRRPRLNIVVDVNAAAVSRRGVTGNLDVRKCCCCSGIEVNAAARGFRGVSGNLDVRKPRRSGVDVNAAAVSRRGVSGNLDIFKARRSGIEVNAAAGGFCGVSRNHDVRKGRLRVSVDVHAAAIFSGILRNRNVREDGASLGRKVRAAAEIRRRRVSGNRNVFKRSFCAGRNNNPAGAVCRGVFTAGKRQVFERGRSGRRRNSEDAGFLVRVDRNAVFAAVDRQRLANDELRAAEDDRRFAVGVEFVGVGFGVEGNRRSERRVRFGVGNRFAETDFAVVFVDDVGQGRNDRRRRFERREFDRRGGGVAVSVLRDDGNAVSRGLDKVGELEGRRVFGGRDVDGFGKRRLTVGIRNDVSGNDFGAGFGRGVPSQRRGRFRRVDNGRFQAGRRGRDVFGREG